MAVLLYAIHVSFLFMHGKKYITIFSLEIRFLLNLKVRKFNSLFIVGVFHAHHDASLVYGSKAGAMDAVGGRMHLVRSSNLLLV